jgi:hypothetical protein
MLLAIALFSSLCICENYYMCIVLDGDDLKISNELINKNMLPLCTAYLIRSFVCSIALLIRIPSSVDCRM